MVRKPIDIVKMRFGLTYLTQNYRTAVLRMAQRLLEKKIINGIECGQIIGLARFEKRSPISYLGSLNLDLIWMLDSVRASV
jgi:hypothetical protein